ncbi:HMG (High mobility group) box domain-containing protein [Spironucleus salmonicida]|uniref:HMG (High mobility group) box domain-containing protein n=1 Tax=Spironucleus salmonicida TaxID=348837 RepID=V6LMM1_9EUKA|nr:HMG (High mobility group) box domain-containing protein [Spironucleus salmonicida]|eukprot:EST44961.1 HMG (high mobility group) box domain-containing protein [Spironucleus salmonicida]
MAEQKPFVEVPKRPPNSYFLFSSKMRTELIDLPQSEFCIRVSELWNKLDEEPKKYFENEAHKLKQQYDLDIAVFRESYPDYEKEKKQERVYKSFIREPEKLVYYVAHIRKLLEDKFVLDDKNKSTILKKMNDFWRKSDAQFKQQYIDLVPQGAAKIAVKQLINEYMVLE